MWSIRKQTRKHCKSAAGQLNNFLHGHTKYFAAVMAYIALLIVSSSIVNAASFHVAIIL